MAVLSKFVDDLRPDQAAAADNHDLHLTPFVWDRLTRRLASLVVCRSACTDASPTASVRPPSRVPSATFRAAALGGASQGTCQCLAELLARGDIELREHLAQV